MPELVSIIIPVYNVCDFLPRCIDSIIKQTYRAFELILVDDGSVDGSSEVCDHYAQMDPRVKVIHQKNAGVSTARNVGMDISSGEYLSFIDADDWIEPDYVERLASAIAEHNVDVAAVGFKYIYENGKREEMEICDAYEILSYTEALNQAMDPIKPWVGFAWNKMIKRTIIMNNSIRFDTEISLCEDSLFNYTAFLHLKKVVKIPGSLYNYYIRHDSATRKAITSNFSSLGTKIVAFEKASILVDEYMEGGQFYSRINSTLFIAIVQYLSTMFSANLYDKCIVSSMAEKIDKVSSKIKVRKLPMGIYARYIIFKMHPRLLYFFERTFRFVKSTQ